MIKVCHIVNLITGKSDGVYAHLNMIFRNYDKENFKHFLIFQGGDLIENEVKTLGVEVFALESLKKKFSFRAIFDIYRILKVNKIDILHTHLIKPYALGGIINIFTRKKFIFNYHGLFLKNNAYYNLIEKSIYYLFYFSIYSFGKVDVVLVPSRRSKQLLMSESNLFPEPLIYFNGYKNRTSLKKDFNIVEQLNTLEANNIVIAVVGRLEIEKRIDDAIRIFSNACIKKNNLFLLIFGNGSLKNELINLSKKLEVASRVTFFDYVPEASQYFQYCDILLFTSDREGMPLTLWEAMANSVPVIAPDVGGFKEILEENNCGLIYEPGNIKDAELKLIQLLDDVQLRKSLGKNGRTAVETKYSEEKFIQQIEKVYEDLVNK